MSNNPSPPPKCDITGKCDVPGKCDSSAKCETVPPSAPPQAPAPQTPPTQTGATARKTTLLIMNGCPHCAEAKEILKDKIQPGRINVVELSSPEGRDLQKKLNVTHVPRIVIEEPGKPLQACQILRSGKALCNDKVVDL